MPTRSLWIAIAALIVAAPLSQAAEPPPETTATSVLGAEVKGANWTVAPTVRSDGFVRLYAVETPYGDFQVNGHRRMSERLQELRALKLLEEMSETRSLRRRSRQRWPGADPLRPRSRPRSGRDDGQSHFRHRQHVRSRGR